MPDFVIAKGDTAPPLEVQVVDDDDNPVDLTEAYRIDFEMTCSSCTVSGVADSPDPENGKVTYEWNEGDTDVARRYEGHFTIIFKSGRKMTVPNNNEITIQVR